MNEQTKLPDIVERLRIVGRQKREDLHRRVTVISGDGDLYDEAADEITRLRSPAPAEDSEAYRLARLIVDHPNNQTESAGLVTGVIIARAFLASRRTTENGEGLREALEIERIILRRLYEKRIEGYTLEMSQEIAALSSGRAV